MLALIGNWVLGNKLKAVSGVALIIAGVVLAIYVGSLHMQISAKNKEVVQLTANIVDLKAELTTEKGKVRVLETKLSGYVSAGKVAQDNAKMWQNQYQTILTHYKKTISNLAEWKPTEGENNCEATTRLLTEYRAGRVPSKQR